MIETLKIKLLNGMHANGEWECALEVSSNNSLDELHQAILHTVNFDNDHMYEFSIGRTFHSLNNLRYECDSALVDEVTVGDIIQQMKGKKLFYMFDYGDSWLFQISKSRKKSFDEKPDVIYPRVILEVGVKPEQYPGWDE